MLAMNSVMRTWAAAGCENKTNDKTAERNFIRMVNSLIFFILEQPPIIQLTFSIFLTNDTMNHTHATNKRCQPLQAETNAELSHYGAPHPFDNP